MTDDILDRIDAATDALCGCGCNEPLPPDGPSAYFLDAEHQWRWQEKQAADPVAVYRSEDPNYQYPPGPMRWRPDLVTAAPDDGLTLQAEQPRGPLTGQVFARDGRPDVLHLRLHDGHRFVGTDVDTADIADDSPELERRAEAAWQRLIRELTRNDRLDSPGQWHRDDMHGRLLAGEDRIDAAGGAVYQEMQRPIELREPVLPRRNTRWGSTRFYHEETAEGTVTFWIPRVGSNVAQRIIDWLGDNRIDIGLVPIAAPIRVSASDITVEMFVQDADGDLEVDDEGELVRVTRVVPLVRPLPPATREPELLRDIWRRETLGIWPEAVQRPGWPRFVPQRRCPACGQHGVPIRVTRLTPAFVEVCRHCREVYSGPTILTDMRRDFQRAGVWLRLSIPEGGHHEMYIADEAIGAAREPAVVLQRTWDRCEERLLALWNRAQQAEREARERDVAGPGPALPAPSASPSAAFEAAQSAAAAINEGRVMVGPADELLSSFVDVGAINNDGFRPGQRWERSTTFGMADLGAANLGVLFGIPVDVDPNQPPDTVRIVPRADRTPPRIVVAPGRSPITPEVQELLRAEFEAAGVRAREAMEQFASWMAPAINDFVERTRGPFAALAERLQAAGVIEPEPPADPMLRALEARRNRNTGPPERRRAPRRIDPTRGTR